MAPYKTGFLRASCKRDATPFAKFAEDPGNANKVVTDPQVQSLGYVFGAETWSCSNSLAIRL